MMNAVIYCNRCGGQNSALAKFCANCGTPFSADAQEALREPPEIMPQPQGPAQAPVYSPPVAVASTYNAPIGGVRYGGFWIRFVAFVIDAIVVAIVTIPVSVLIALFAGLAGGAVSMPGMGVHLVRFIISFAFSTLVNWIYEAALESSSHQATLGKMALGLKVTDTEGRQISFARASGRHFAKILSGMILVIGYIMAGFTERKQALHDVIAGTLVVRAL
jgi:uncharacterized RDD family membrane protein YckC